MSEQAPRLGRRRLAIVGLVALLFCLAVAAYAGFVFLRIQTYSAPKDGVADCAILLGAATRKTKPTPDFTNRLEHTLERFQGGHIKWIITTGDHTPGEPLTCARVAAEWLRERGVPDAAIIQEPCSRVTYENLVYAKQLADERGIDDFIIISDPMHLPRAMAMARSLNMNARPSAGPSIYQSRKGRWWMGRRELVFHFQFCLIVPFTGAAPMEEACARPPRPNDKR
jgi:uncharacterized SAM-binding protein YcdF (DUF218 family)